MDFFPIFTLDDAYIVQHAVNNIINFSNENVFLGAEKNSGLTSPLHVGVVAIFSLILGVNWAQFIVSSACFSLFLVTVFAYCNNVNKNIWMSICITIVAAISGKVVEQVFNGLETGLVLFLVTLALYLYRESIPKRPIAIIVLVLMPFVRPELFFLSAVLFVRFLCESSKKNSVDDVKKGVLIAFVVGITLIIYSYLVTGHLLPNTANAKKYFFAEACQNFTTKIDFITSGVEGYLADLGILSIGFLLIFFTRYRFVFAVFFIIFYLLYFMELPGGVHHNYFRYQYVLYPFAVVGLIEILALYKINLSNYFCGILAGCTVITSHSGLNSLDQSLRFTKFENMTMGWWVEQNLTKNDVVLIHDAGYISTVTKSKLVDIVGLKTKDSVEINLATRYLSCGNDPRAIDAIASQYKATYFVVLSAWDQIFQLTNSLRATGWKVVRVDNERGDSAYKVYKISK